MKKYIIFILLIVFSIITINILAEPYAGYWNGELSPELPFPNPTPDNEVGVKVTTDKDTYYLGEDIKIYITATNLTSSTLRVPIYLCNPPPHFVQPPPQPGITVYPELLHPRPVSTDYKIDDSFIWYVWAKYNGSFIFNDTYRSYAWNYTYSTKSLSLGKHTITGYFFGYGTDITNLLVQSSIGPAWEGLTTIAVPYIFDTTPITIITPSISATIDIDPDTLNQKSKGKWITCYIELPSEYDVNNINIASIQISVINNNQITPIYAELHPTEIGDYDNDGIPDLMVKFNRQEVQKYINKDTGSLTITVEGKLDDGSSFAGTDNIRTVQNQKDQDKKQLPKLGVFNNKINPNKNEHAIIRYYLDKPSHVKITIYNIVGEKIKTIVDRHQGTGTFEEIWQGVNENGSVISSGLYIVHIKTDQIDETRKMIVIK